MSEQHDTALQSARTYIESWTSGDFPRLEALLDPAAKLSLPYSGDTPAPAYAFDGRDDVLGYLQFAHSTFVRLEFREQQWVVGDDARFVYLHAIGDMAVKADGQRYVNVYLLRFELAGSTIVEVLEYTNPIIWNALGIG